MPGNKQMVSRLQSAGRLIERAKDNRDYNAAILVGGRQDELRSWAKNLSIFITLDKFVDFEQSTDNCVDE